MIQSWFAAVSLVVAAAVAFGAAVTIGTGAMLLGLSLVPPAIVLLLWPEVKGPTVADVPEQFVTIGRIPTFAVAA